ncbi:DUF1156 domain-containing protein, partial [Myxococcota bacterium]|nr:DUF1156 domain-containing protein [Myxococcota bacterium]
MTNERLIEHWLPIAEIGEESVRERRSMTALPPTYYLHVWWARRPLVASRAAILASLLPADADRKKFMHMLGIHGDPVESKRRMAIATRKGERLGAAAYGYKRAFSYQPVVEEIAWLKKNSSNEVKVLDPTAGGGSIPFEAIRLGLESISNDLNPVASLIELATVAWPVKFGKEVKKELICLTDRFIVEIRKRLTGVFPDEPEANCIPDGYLWARTIVCPSCGGVIPLSPNWRLAPDGTGVRLVPQTADGKYTPGRVCTFEIVHSLREHSDGTVAGGDARCPYPDCGIGVDGDEVKRQAQAGGMGDQLFCVVFKKRVESLTKTGRRTEKWERGYRSPRPEDDNSTRIREILVQKMEDWEALDIVPNEKYDTMFCDRSKIYGVNFWRDLFSARQLLCHGTSVEIFQEMLREARADSQLDELHKAAFGYLALSLDKLRDYNSRMTRWHVNREVMVNTFDRHDFSFKWSYAESAPLIVGLGYDWAFEQTAKCIQELVDLVRPASAEPNSGDLFASLSAPTCRPPKVTVTCQSAARLSGIAAGSVDLVVMDPPYYDNVMYAELSDFFYVWLKRTAGLIFPELFRLQLTDKEHEAVANPARFAGQKKSKDLAGEDYRDKMAGIFAECR